MMDRNAESHFGHIETTDIKRSMFQMPFRNLSTCNAGKIIPFLAYADILPGDTVKCTTSAVIRMQTPLNPTMDDLFADIYYFAIPKRILWKHWAEFMGENKDSAWVSSTVYQEPMFTAPASTGVTMGTVADYMGIPKGVTNIKYSELPFRGYVLTYNTWFRRQNLIAPATEYDDDTDRNGSNTTTELGGVPFSASKIADYFTTCAVEAEKPLPGMSTPTIPLGTSAPVVGTGKALGFTDGTNTFGSVYNTGSVTHLDIRNDAYNANNGATYSGSGVGANKVVGITTDATKSGMIADLTNATAATINALRLYFQIQKMFEARSRGGTRLFEILKQEFGTSPSMAVLQLPEYLGGKRQPLNLTQVTQTSSTVNNGQALGDTGGMSHTAFTNEDFTKSFQEHSILLGLLVIRQYHTYQQGLHRMWTRRNKLDYYTPVLAHLGEQPVYKKEIYATGVSANDDAVWGYQERWGEYKYGQQIITGEMNSTYATSLDVWHYGDYYASAPTLAQNWIEETPAYVDRTIAVTSSTAHQFKFDIVSNMVFTRPMPVYNTPGLIDHF